MYFTPNFCAKDFPAENGEFVMFLDDVCLCVVNLEVVITQGVFFYCSAKKRLSINFNFFHS